MNPWISAARPRTLPLALSGLLAGNAMALSACLQANRPLRWDVALLSLATAVALQVLSNFANDLGDTENGADNLGRIGPQRAVQAGLLTRNQMRGGVFFMTAVALLLGIFMLFQAFGSINSSFIQFLFLGVGAIFAALLYTWGKKPYGYAGLGDLSVFLFFGPTAVLGSYALHGLLIGYISVWFAAFAIGFCAVAVLNLNNMRDRENDGLAGKKTIPVRMGQRFAFRYHTLLVGNAVGLFIAMLFPLAALRPWLLLVLLPIYLLMKDLKPILMVKDPVDFDPFLKKTALKTFFIVVLFSVGLMIVR
jgi:1,4-dihydroxy-2-naphthoate octaprenyltransferase